MGKIILVLRAAISLFYFQWNDQQSCESKSCIKENPALGGAVIVLCPGSPGMWVIMASEILDKQVSKVPQRCRE